QLAFFKYFEFFHGLFESALLYLELDFTLPIADIIFPIGISFFTFQGLAYTLDVYRDRGQLVRNPVHILLFVSFFPTVLSGPIMRAKDFIPRLTRSNYDSQALQTGFALILSGLFMKVVIASYLSEYIVRPVFQVPENFSSLAVLAGVYSYSIQIFCDFAGYSDLAIGLAMLLGYHVPENFKRPYLAANLQEFWHRWHISFSTWLRDYLYIPLGGNKKGLWRKYLNLMITMVLGGLWHGAHTRFLLWGALHGLGLVLSHVYADIRQGRLLFRARPIRKTRPRRKKGPDLLKKIGLWFLTFNFVSFLWVFFRAEDTGQAFRILKAVFSVNQPGLGFEFLVIPAILAGLGLQLFGRYFHEAYLSLQNRLPVPVQGLTVAVICIIIMRLGPEGALPFIYFQF
ncbi:MAG: MBOAT family O-acyltransferase, partial [Pseudomonadota bacterium]